MNDENSKTCRFCAESVSVNAKVCPHCRQWLTRLSLRNPTILLGAICILIAMGMLAFDIDMHESFLRPGTDFSPYKNQISVTESHMIFGTNYYEKAPAVSVIAIVTNQTDLAWKEIPLEVRFFDKEGTLVDIGYGLYFDTLYPKSDGAVKIEAASQRPLADYNSYKIYVGSARDPRSILK